MEGRASLDLKEWNYDVTFNLIVSEYLERRDLFKGRNLFKRIHLEYYNWNGHSAFR